MNSTNANRITTSPQSNHKPTEPTDYRKLQEFPPHSPSNHKNNIKKQSSLPISLTPNQVQGITTIPSTVFHSYFDDFNDFFAKSP